jgi:hypothetical protein
VDAEDPSAIGAGSQDPTSPRAERCDKLALVAEIRVLTWRMLFSLVRAAGQSL